MNKWKHVAGGSCRKAGRPVAAGVVNSRGVLSYLKPFKIAYSIRSMNAVATTLKLLTPQQAADRLGLSLRRVHQFLADGRLGQRVGGVYVITEEDLREFQKKPRNPGRPPEDDE